MTDTTTQVELTPDEARTLLNALDFQYGTLVANHATALCVENRLARRKIEAAL